MIKLEFVEMIRLFSVMMSIDLTHRRRFGIYKTPGSGSQYSVEKTSKVSSDILFNPLV